MNGPEVHSWQTGCKCRLCATPERDRAADAVKAERRACAEACRHAAKVYREAANDDVSYKTKADYRAGASMASNLASVIKRRGGK